MTDNLKSNGFGRFEKHLIFSVPKQYVAKLTGASWDVLHNDGIGTEGIVRLAERGVDVSYETIHKWVHKFGRFYAKRIKARPEGFVTLTELTAISRRHAPYVYAAAVTKFHSVLASCRNLRSVFLEIRWRR